VTKRTAHLENWRIENVRDFLILVGNVTGHYYIPDGDLIHTTKIIGIGDNLAETKNTVYTLGAARHESSE